MFFDVWKAYKEACGKGPWMEDRIAVLQELERRIRESERARIDGELAARAWPIGYQGD